MNTTTTNLSEKKSGLYRFQYLVNRYSQSQASWLACAISQHFDAMSRTGSPVADECQKLAVTWDQFAKEREQEEFEVEVSLISADPHLTSESSIKLEPIVSV